MTYKTIAAYLASPDRAASVIDVALPLAEAFEAHLIGMHAAPGIPVAGTIGAQIPPGIIEQYRQLLMKNSQKIEKIFTDRTKTTTAPVEWRGMEEKVPRVDLLNAIAGQTLCADLVVMGQSDGELREGKLAAEVVMGTGRPVLIIPKTGSFDGTAKRITVAWDGSREAARAAFDSLPLLVRAEHASVVTIHEDHGRKSMDRAGSEELAHVLARHEVKVEAADITTGSISIGERLQSHMADQDSDLLVMGCYGHSRLRERLFGGVTREMLAEMVTPVLMSH